MTDWKIGGTEVPTVKEESITSLGVGLVWRANETDLNNHLRALDSDSGKLERRVDSDGDFTVIDTAQGNNTYNLTPNSNRSSIHTSGDYLVKDYTEIMEDQSGSYYEVSVDFAYTTPRDPTTTINETRGTGEWLFDFTANVGEIATPNVKADIQRPSDDTGSASITLNAFLTIAQARAIAEGPTRTEATSVREFTDGSNQVVDNSDASRNEVVITVPTGTSTTLSDGTYIINDWTLEMLNNDFYSVEMALWEA